MFKKLFFWVSFTFSFLGFLSPVIFAADSSLPVEVKNLGLTDNNIRVQFEVKINTDKPVSQVDIDQKFMDASGKVVKQVPLAWQNIVNGQEIPIEKGKTYTSKVRLQEGAAKAELKVLRVIFKDGTEWKAP